MSSNILGLMHQLKESQEKAKAAEARCKELSDMNAKLTKELALLRSTQSSDNNRGTIDQNILVIELQKQLAATVNRNRDLELEMHQRLYDQRESCSRIP